MEWLQSLDQNILLFIQEHLRIEKMTPFWMTITFLGDSGWFWIMTSSILLLFKKTRKVGILALFSLGCSFLITNVFIKNVVARTRPYNMIDAIILLISEPKDYSFPSGHTCASFAAACIYYRMLPKKYGIPALVLAFLIGFSRLYLGVHYFTDVAGGLLVGVFCSVLVYTVSEKIIKKNYKNQKLEETLSDKRDVTR